jgi:hypothetical protein
VNREGVLGLFLVALLLGGVFLLTRRPTASYASTPQSGQGNIQFVPAEPRRYQNKEIRQIKYNEENLPVEITITRDYAIT